MGSVGSNSNLSRLSRGELEAAYDAAYDARDRERVKAILEELAKRPSAESTPTEPINYTDSMIRRRRGRRR